MHHAEPITPLSPAERLALQDRESIIEGGQQAAKATWKALAEIHDLQLYRELGTWEDYLQKRWGIKAAHGYRQVAAAAIDVILTGAGVAIPTERRLRPLTKILELPEGLQDATARAMKAIFGSKPSSSEVEAFAESLKELVNTGHIPHPETGEPTPWTDIPEQVRGEVFRATVTQQTYHTLQRQKGHVDEAIRQRQQSGQGFWADAPIRHVKENPRHEIVFRIKSINGEVAVLPQCLLDGQILYSAENVPYLKGAVLALMRELGELPEKEEAL